MFHDTGFQHYQFQIALPDSRMRRQQIVSQILLKFEAHLSSGKIYPANAMNCLYAETLSSDNRFLDPMCRFYPIKIGSKITYHSFAIDRREYSADRRHTTV
jgi:hypothetical protein